MDPRGLELSPDMNSSCTSRKGVRLTWWMGDEHRGSVTNGDLRFERNRDHKGSLAGWL